MKKCNSPPTSACPCGSARALAECCSRYHGGAPAPDAETLMRSRYSAYVLGNEAYLLSTWHETTRPASIEFGAEAKTRWLGLEVRRHALTGPGTATVEFVARYKIGGRAYRMHETSRFMIAGDRWYYVDGELHDSPSSR